MMSSAIGDDEDEPTINAPLLVDAEVPRATDPATVKAHLATITNTPALAAGEARYDLDNPEAKQSMPFIMIHFLPLRVLNLGHSRNEEQNNLFH